MLSALIALFFSIPQSHSALSIERAQQIIQTFEYEVNDPVLHDFGATFEFLFNTDIPIPQAVVASSADRFGNEWMVSILAASASHPKLTSDAFVLLICHELGHHFGGAPYKNDDRGQPRWASTEGQADYFATSVCGKRMFAQIRPDSAVPAPTADIVRACRARLHGRDEIELCARQIMASTSLVAALAEKDYPWTAHDPLVVSAISGVEPSPVDGHYEYPSYDCRMETLRHGAFCQKLAHPTTDDLLGRSGRDGDCAGPSDGRPACWY